MMLISKALRKKMTPAVGYQVPYRSPKGKSAAWVSGRQRAHGRHLSTQGEEIKPVLLCCLVRPWGTLSAYAPQNSLLGPF